jgi:hypothetical protein
MQYSEQASAPKNARLLPALACAQDLRDIYDPAMPMFILIDPMLGEPLPGMALEVDSASAQSAREAGWERAVEPIVLPSRVALPSHQHPYLVALSGMDDPLLELTLEIAHAERSMAQEQGLDGEGGAAHRIAGWLQTSMHVEKLAEHLSHLFRVNTTAYTKATYLRLVDRRALALMRHVVGDERLTGQFGRLRRWSYIDAIGKLAMLRNEGDEITPLRLNDDEWRFLEQGESIHRALAQWLGEIERAGDVTNSSAQQLYAQFSLAAGESKSVAKQWPHRFAGLPDQTTWSALSLLHPGLVRMASVRNLMQEPGTADEPADLVRYLHQKINMLAMNATAK